MYHLLKDKVTHFSSQLKTNPKNELEVIVGGKIKEIYPPLNLVIDAFTTESTNEKIETIDFSEYYTVIIDDGLGELLIYVSKDLYKHYESSIQKENICIFKSFTHTLTRSIQGVFAVELSLYAYDIETTEKEEVCI